MFVANPIMNIRLQIYYIKSLYKIRVHDAVQQAKTAQKIKEKIDKNKHNPNAVSTAIWDGNRFTIKHDK